MKLAWICYIYDHGNPVVKLVFEKPDTERERYDKVVAIVYAEIKS